MDFLVAKDDLHNCRFLDAAAPDLEPGQALLEVSAFGLSANNITYAMFGQAMSYWNFFPADDGWGRVPVWGFAEVASSRVDSLEPGTRVYGYLAPSTSFVVSPARVDAHGFLDSSAHRAALPSAYNSYVRVDGDPSYDARYEDQQMLLRPLFFTSYLIDDFLEDGLLDSAGTVVLSSASSKTASALAFLLARRDGVEIIGLTSERSVEFTGRLDVYDDVVTYEDIGSLAQDDAIYVDMSGNSDVRSAVHEHYGKRLVHSAVVGATHHDRMGDVPDALPGPRPQFFFAPDRVAKRGKDWGREGLEQRLADAWAPYVGWTGDWLEVIHGHGPKDVEQAYLDLLDGRIDPARAHVLSL